jgi:hypothetical protein
MNQIELEKRTHAWEALSCLYLDNEFDLRECEYVMKMLKKSSYDFKEIDIINRVEVFPALIWNLIYNPTPVDDFFDEKFIFEICLKNFKRKNNVFFLCYCYFLKLLFWWAIKNEWCKLQLFWKNA